MHAMPRRRIGSLAVSVVGLGCNNFGGRTDEATSRQVVAAALDAGVNFFDTADIYGGTRSEEILGSALGKRRSEVVVATKFGMPLDDERKGAAPSYVKRAIEDSLRRLGTDYVDLYQLHQPDPGTPLEATLEALAGLVAAGKVREIGCSNFSVEQLREAESCAVEGAPRFVSVQNEYSLLHRAPELGELDECDRQGLAFVPYFPLHAGVLTGKYRRGIDPPQGTRLAGLSAQRRERFLRPETHDAVEGLEAFASARGHTLLDLAFSWLLAKPAVASVIAGATRPEQVRANVAAAAWSITPAEVAEVDAIAPTPE